MAEEREPVFDFQGKNESLENLSSSHIREVIQSIFEEYECMGGEYSDLDLRLLRDIILEDVRWWIASATLDGRSKMYDRQKKAREAELEALRETLEPDLVAILREGKKITAIKHLRMVAGAENTELAEAKEQIDALYERVKRGEFDIDS